MVATLGAGLLLGTSAVGAAFAADPSATTPTDYYNVFTGKVAQVAGVDQQKLADATTQARNDTIDQMVKDGVITADWANIMKERAALVGTSGFYGGPMHGGMWGGRFGGPWLGTTTPVPAPAQ